LIEKEFLDFHSVFGGISPNITVETKKTGPNNLFKIAWHTFW
jgi:hypothetical protein